MSSQPPKQSQKIAIIAAETGWGSGHLAAERGPALLFKEGLADRLGAAVARVPSQPSMAEGELQPREQEIAIMHHASRVSDAVLDAVQKGMFPVVIGGDHTSAIGFHTGLARAFGETGTVWIDTHPDLNTPESSPSGNIHGMVLAGVLGRGSLRMLEVTQSCQMQDAHVAMVGIRSIDAGEQAWLDEGNINCMTMDMVRDRGLSLCMLEAIGTANQAEAGYGLTIDLDAIDPSQAPFVATPVDGGIDAHELTQTLLDLPRKDRLLGMEVVEFTPRNDNDGKEACNLVGSLVEAVVGKYNES
ncbi:MAG: arginase family protein [Phycisphaerales bacterium]|nr:arginase family protein [Phycisphaerales bacterium]